MKRFVLVTVVFAFVIGCVVMASLNFGDNTSQSVNHPIPAVQPVAAVQTPPPATSPQPEPVKVVYVPQVIEKVYVKEIHTREIVQETEKNDEPATGHAG